MRNLFKTLAAIVLLSSVTLLSCQDPPKGDNAVISGEQKTADVEGTEYQVDLNDSRIRFIGYGVGKSHPGTFRLTSGNVAVANNLVTGGTFSIDINSLELEQKGGMFDEKLRPHLLSGDFFDAAKFGTAKFELTGVAPYNSVKDTSIVKGANYLVSGNLTLKDVTKNISFPARIDLDGKTLKAEADFDIDRTQWKMNYGNDKTLGDKFISEKVRIKLDLKAKKM